MRHKEPRLSNGAHNAQPDDFDEFEDDDASQVATWAGLAHAPRALPGTAAHRRVAVRSPRPPVPSHSRSQGRASGRHHDHGEGHDWQGTQAVVVKLSALHRELRRAGCDLLWLNPEQGIIGTPYILEAIRPQGAGSRPGNFGSPAQDRARPAAPYRWHRSARLRADRLEDCSLDHHTGRFATPAHRWLADEAAQAERLTRQQRTAAPARQQAAAARARQARQQWQHSLKTTAASSPQRSWASWARGIAVSVLVLVAVLIMLLAVGRIV